MIKYVFFGAVLTFVETATAQQSPQGISIDYFQRFVIDGGLITWVVLIPLSIATFAIIVEHILSIRASHLMGEQLYHKLAGAINKGDITGLREGAKKKNNRKNEFNFNVSNYLSVILGTDASDIYGISDDTALVLFAETGGDLSSFKSADHFTSWAGLAPNNKISGGKIISSHLPKKKHPIKRV